MHIKALELCLRELKVSQRSFTNKNDRELVKENQSHFISFDRELMIHCMLMENYFITTPNYSSLIIIIVFA